MRFLHSEQSEYLVFSTKEGCKDSLSIFRPEADTFLDINIMKGCTVSIGKQIEMEDYERQLNGKTGTRQLNDQPLLLFLMI